MPTMSPSSPTLLRIAGALAAAGGLAVAVSTVGPARAAVPMSATDTSLAMTCQAPIVGALNITVNVHSEFTAQVPAGEPVTGKITFSAAVPANGVQAFKAVGGATLDFAADVTGTWSGAIAAPAQAKATGTGLTPPAQGAWPIAASVDVTAPTTAAGPATLNAGPVQATITARMADGQPTQLGTLTVPCTMTGNTAIFTATVA